MALERTRKRFRYKKRTRMAETEEIAALEALIQAGAPVKGSNPLASSLSKDATQEVGKYAGAKLFEQLPISEKTKSGLADAKYKHLTAIQRAALPHALCGRDVLGAAKTGSGKTLAFLIPVVEKLFRLQWSSMDGVGAIIISPTRELAIQIFEELCKVGKHQSLSGGLLIGGRKGVDLEKECVNNLNILVCTPGRLLQHMDETPNFECQHLQVLVLDEADRILDLGFMHTLNAILAQLPKQRQTLLFSATQTRSVQDLARLSLKDPEYLAVHAESVAATPARLKQTAMIVPLDEKLDMLWSFIKTHLHSKTLVFLSSCKQVKFVYECLKRLHPGVPIKCLHGRMKQAQRMLVFFKFFEEKHSVLFATDVAARGLDFPAIDWVVQVDCPEDVPSYIHRVGRTARYTSGGRSVIFLSPSEKKMITELQAAKIPIKVIKANQSKIQRISGALSSLLSKDSDLKYMAQRAFVTYLRSIYLRPNKDIFDVMKLPLEDFAVSLGLPTAPRIRFLKCISKKASTQDDYQARRSDSILMHSEVQNMVRLPSGESKAKERKTSLERKNADVMPCEEEAEEAQDLMIKVNLAGGFPSTRKRAKEGQNDLMNSLETSLGTRVNKNKRLKINPNRPAGQRLVFDDEGNAVPPLAAFAQRIHSDQDTISAGSEKFLEEAAQQRYKKLKEVMQKMDQEDKVHERQRLRERRNKQKQRSTTESQGDSLLTKHSGEIDGENSLHEDKVVAQKRYFTDYSSEDSEGPNAHELCNQKFVPGNREGERMELGRLSMAMQEAVALKLLTSRS